MDAADTGFDYLSSTHRPWHDVVHGSVIKERGTRRDASLFCLFGYFFAVDDIDT